MNPVFLLFAGLALLALVPLGLTLWRVGTPRGRRDAAIALHRAQLAELDSELADGRIGATEHQSATLEVQRRLLAIAEEADDNPALARSARMPLILALFLLPLGAEGLYLINGQPQLAVATVPVVPKVNDAAEAEKLITTLRARLADLDPKKELTAQGYVLLGNAEASRGHLGEAAAAWRTALEAGFNPALAAQAAEAQTQADGKVTDDTKALFRRALAQAPPDAPWRGLVERRLGGG